MKVIITIKLHFFMVVAYFIQSDFLKTSLAKLTTLRWKRAKRQVFLRLIITAKHHIQPPSTRILIFFNPQHFWSVLKKIPPTQVHVFKPIHWTPLNYLRSIGSMSSSRRVLRSCDRIVFYGPSVVSSIPFDGCYVFASFSCLRVVRFSFRRLCYIFSLELFETLHFF